MKTVIFNTVNAVFRFDQKDVMKFLMCQGSNYDLDEVAKLLELISADNNETIVIPEEPNYFDSIAIDLIAAGKGFMLVVCITCNKTYVAGQLNPIVVGFDGSPLDIQRERKGVLMRYNNYQIDRAVMPFSKCILGAKISSTMRAEQYMFIKLLDNI